MMPRRPATRPMIQVIFLGADGAAIELGVIGLVCAQDDDIALLKDCRSFGMIYRCFRLGKRLRYRHPIHSLYSHEYIDKLNHYPCVATLALMLFL